MQNTTTRLPTWQITFYIIALGIRGSHWQCPFTDIFLISQTQQKESIFVLGLPSQNFLCLTSSSYDLKGTLVLLRRGQGTHFKQWTWDHPQLVPLFCFLPIFFLNLAFTKTNVLKEGGCKPAKAIVPGISLWSPCKIGKYMASAAFLVAQISAHYYLLYPLLCSFMEARSYIIILMQLFWLFLWLVCLHDDCLIHKKTTGWLWSRHLLFHVWLQVFFPKFHMENKMCSQ